MRLHRTIIFLASMAVATACVLGAGTASASAAVTCKTYDKLHLDAGPVGYPVDAPARGCLYPATDYPGFQGTEYAGHPCGGGVLPYDYDDAIPMIACLVQPTVFAWRYTPGVNGGWTAARLAAGTTQVWPFAGNWRWAYRNGSWYAVQASDLNIRWFCQAGYSCYAA